MGFVKGQDVGVAINQACLGYSGGRGGGISAQIWEAEP
eukprot:CAMPEP_0180599692 /NCGR_PEP_ID=MMETSP1037_2-20121125/23528_1 /TAXON_ID=632150 /ORGANISM="Azadinium spinosum, Strain 3D9" /LENGTH=37 /DNA_ID= /DNA_START= /DNA_END= /DNA_ORIENTATION=